MAFIQERVLAEISLSAGKFFGKLRSAKKSGPGKRVQLIDAEIQTCLP